MSIVLLVEGCVSKMSRHPASENNVLVRPESTVPEFSMESEASDMTEVEFTLTDLDFQLEALDLSGLSPVEFEHLLFHLLDEMGFSNIVWRKGTKEGNSATDGGRDLEATYWRVDPTGSTTVQYWFESKYRSGTLEKSQVQKAILDAAAKPHLDHAVIVTNSAISNPCMDWIAEHREKHPRPEISVWQNHDLERLLRKNPRTLSRFLPTALSLRGRCKVLESRFTNLFLLPSVDELAELWERRDAIQEHEALAACIFSETAFGDLEARPWGMEIDASALVHVIASTLVNIFYLAERADTFGRDQTPMIEGLVYLVSCLLVRKGHKATTYILHEPEAALELDHRLPVPLNSARMRPILGVLFQQFGSHCSNVDYCKKLHFSLPEAEPSAYFARFQPQESESIENTRFLVMTNSKEKCQINVVPDGDHCPLGSRLAEEAEITSEELGAMMKFAEKVLRARIEELREQRT